MFSHYNPADQQLAIQWARSLLDTGSFYVIDTETTGLDADDEIIQIGVIDQDGSTILDTFIKPQQRIAPEASRVHGIWEHDLDSAQTFPELYSAIQEALGERVILAYNIDFDWRLMTQTIMKYDLNPIMVRERMDVMRWYAQYRGVWNRRRFGYRWHKLTDACAYEGITVADAHSAVGDCLMTLALVYTMASA